MTNREKFLRDNVGFHFEDLSLAKQIELQTIVKEMGVSTDWMLLALSKDKIENWEKWGFALFRKPDFRANVDALERTIKNMSEEKFKQEIRKNQKNPTFYVDNKVFTRIWNGVREQGKLYTDEEAAARSMTSYWTYSHLVAPECRTNIDAMLLEPELTDDDKEVFVLSVKKVELSYSIAALKGE